MDFYPVQGSNDFMVPNEQYGLDVMSTSTEDWFHWGGTKFVNDEFPRKYSGTSAKEKLTNLNCDTRVSLARESKVPLIETSGCSNASVDCLTNDSSMGTSDDLFHDLLDFEMQDSAQNMDDIFLNCFLEQDLMHIENPYDVFDTTDSMQLPWNLRMTVLDDLETLTKDSIRKEDADPNFRTPQPVELSPSRESSATAVASEPVCIEATVLHELENVMFQLSNQTRICIRDALYRLANRSKEQQNINPCQSGMTLESSPCSEICSGNPRQELLKSFEPKTNVIDRAIATLMFDMPQSGAASGSRDSAHL